MGALTIIAEAPGTVQTIISFFVKGGLFMWPLLACSIVAVTTIILRGIALREKNVMPLVIQSEIERRAPGAPDADREPRRILAGPDNARCPPALARPALRERRGGANARASRNGAA